MIWKNFVALVLLFSVLCASSQAKTIIGRTRFVAVISPTVAPVTAPVGSQSTPTIYPITPVPTQAPTLYPVVAIPPQMSPDFSAELNAAMQMTTTCAANGIPVSSGIMPSGAAYHLQIEGSQFVFDYQGLPGTGSFRIAGDLAGGHGSVQGTLPSGSSIAWSW